MSFASWVESKRWAANVRRAREFRATLLFSERQLFDRKLRRPVCFEPGLVYDYPELVYDYPDMFYMVTIDDLCRAMDAVLTQRVGEPK